MFNDLTGKELVDLISADLDNIKIRSVSFESKSHKTEYAKIYFSYCGIIIRFPYIEIVDSGDVSLDRGSMTDDFQGDDELDVFVALKCVAIKAQEFIDDNPNVLSKFLNRYDVFKECSKHRILDHPSSALPNSWYSQYDRLALLHRFTSG